MKNFQTPLISVTILVLSDTTLSLKYAYCIYYSVKHPRLFFKFIFPLPLYIQEYKMFSKIRTVKEEVERAKYSKLIICPLINYICFRIKSRLERKK